MSRVHDDALLRRKRDEHALHSGYTMIRARTVVKLRGNSNTTSEQKSSGTRFLSDNTRLSGRGEFVYLRFVHVPMIIPHWYHSLLI